MQKGFRNALDYSFHASKKKSKLGLTSFPCNSNLMSGAITEKNRIVDTQKLVKKGEGGKGSICVEPSKNELCIDLCIGYLNTCMSLKYLRCARVQSGCQSQSVILILRHTG